MKIKFKKFGFFVLVLFGSKNRDGIFITGPNEGLSEQRMFRMEQDGGVYKPSQPITTKIKADSAIALVKSATARGVPLSFNIMMWEDGSVPDFYVKYFKRIKKRKNV